jgi:hypothetical protein
MRAHYPPGVSSDDARRDERRAAGDDHRRHSDDDPEHRDVAVRFARPSAKPLRLVVWRDVKPTANPVTHGMETTSASSRRGQASKIVWRNPSTTRAGAQAAHEAHHNVAHDRS